MSDVDFTGSRAMGHVLDACDRDHIAFGVARAGEHLRDTMQRSGLMQRIGEGHFYPSVNEAVSALANEPQSP